MWDTLSWTLHDVQHLTYQMEPHLFICLPMLSPNVTSFVFSGSFSFSFLSPGFWLPNRKFPSSKQQLPAKPFADQCSGYSVIHLKDTCCFFLSLDYFVCQSLVFPGDLGAGGNESKQDAFTNIPCSFDLRGICQEMERLALLPEKTNKRNFQLGIIFGKCSDFSKLIFSL